jgi:hypothetical protein
MTKRQLRIVAASAETLQHIDSCFEALYVIEGTTFFAGSQPLSQMET